MTSKDKEVRDLPERKIPDNKADQVKGGAITLAGQADPVRQTHPTIPVRPPRRGSLALRSSRIWRMTPQNRKPQKDEKAPRT
jgi:hypothetical protein